MATTHAHTTAAAGSDAAAGRPTQPLRDEHEALQPAIAQLQTLADSIGVAPAAEVRRGVDQAYDFLAHHLVPHAATEDHAIYPKVARIVGSPAAIATMTREHEEIGHYARQLGAVRTAIAAQPVDQPLDPADERQLRRLLYGAQALVMAHLANEETVFMPLLDTNLTPEQAAHMYHAAEAAAHQITPSRR